MVDAIAVRLGVPTTAVIALAVLIAIQLLLQVLALVDLARRDTVMGGRRWVWAVVILAGNVIGPIVYLAVGRHATRPGADDGIGTGATTRKTLDDLYGSGQRDAR